MNLLLRSLQAVGLGLTIFPAWLHFKGMLALPITQHSMLAGTALWFVASLSLDWTRTRRPLGSRSVPPPSSR